MFDKSSANIGPTENTFLDYHWKTEISSKKATNKFSKLLSASVFAPVFHTARPPRIEVQREFLTGKAAKDEPDFL